MESIAPALLTGLTIGFVIAVQFGAVSLLVVETAVVRGPRAGVAAGMGVATADLVFAAVAIAAGGAAGALLASHGSGCWARRSSPRSPSPDWSGRRRRVRPARSR